jgi:hypothetical protein
MILGPHLRTPNPGFNPGFTPAFVMYKGAGGPRVKPGVLRPEMGALGTKGRFTTRNQVTVLANYAQIWKSKI